MKTTSLVPVLSEATMNDSENSAQKALLQSEHVINFLIEKTNKDKTLGSLLVASLHKAKISAKEQLEPDLFSALLWPKDLAEYNQYLLSLARWMPEESNS
jgi:phosphatidylserine decarboxylase